MKIEMIIQIQGTRDGQDWPAPGGTIDVPDDEGATLCAAGLATPVKSTGKVETADAPAPARKRSTKAKA